MCHKTITTWPTVSREAVAAILPSIKCGAYGFNRLLTIGGNPKTDKSDKGGVWLSAILHLTPGFLCMWATRGCLRGCLHTAGNRVYWKGKKRARKARTDLFLDKPEVFVALLVYELRLFVAKCKKLGLRPCVRLNGTSDVPWERVCPWLFQEFKGVRFYDYTKGVHRLGFTPRNYHLTLSRSETNGAIVDMMLERGFHVAVVIRDAKHNRPKYWRGWRTEDGDKDDLLFLRKHPVQVLYPKGRAKSDRSGWVIDQLVQAHHKWSK